MTGVWPVPRVVAGVERGRLPCCWRVWDTGDGESWLRLKVPATECPRIKRSFLDTERKKLDSGLTALREAEREVSALEHRVIETFPEEQLAKT